MKSLVTSHIFFFTLQIDLTNSTKLMRVFCLCCTVLTMAVKIQIISFNTVRNKIAWNYFKESVCSSNTLLQNTDGPINALYGKISLCICDMYRVFQEE
jgi:hypothetical protein